MASRPNPHGRYTNPPEDYRSQREDKSSGPSRQYAAEDSEPWNESFPFSREVMELEKDLSMGDSEGENNSRSSRSSGFTSSPFAHSAEASFSGLDEEDIAHLDQFSQIVAQAILEKVSQDEFLAKCLSVSELKRDNQILASQVRRLLHDKKVLEGEVARLEKEMNHYKKIAGNLFLKID